MNLIKNPFKAINQSHIAKYGENEQNSPHRFSELFEEILLPTIKDKVTHGGYNAGLTFFLEEEFPIWLQVMDNPTDDLQVIILTGVEDGMMKTEELLVIVTRDWQNARLVVDMPDEYPGDEKITADLRQAVKALSDVSFEVIV